MRCYNVLVHGTLDWLPGLTPRDEIGVTKPHGFYCHRFVLAPDEAKASDTALRRVRANLDKQTGWLRDGLATVELHAEEITGAPMRKLLMPDNRGHTFYNAA